MTRPALLLLLLLAGCTPHYLVRECGAIVGDHFSAQKFAWVQPCHREEVDGCEEACRPARSACEADKAVWRDKRLWWLGPGGVTEAEAKWNLEDLKAKMDQDCK